ncbi:hypothetical protein MHU86_20494 [Fragilaria crotonensis]|nr:hypothetical protein MHU86_20494 [Fragilaria crotonensis]
MTVTSNQFFSLTLILLSILAQFAFSFTVVTPVYPRSLSRVTTARFLADEQDQVPIEETPSESIPLPAVSPPKPKRQLDGLMAAVTRTAPSDSNTPTTNLPFFGELPIDGSLLVLAPAAAIAVLGFVMSVVVAFNAKDTFVDQLTVLSQEINTAALAKTNSASDGSCRGLCSSQDQQLEGMRIFMESLARSK